MITRTEAERIAQSIHVVRQDWPVASLVTFIERELSNWPLLDAYVGLAYVAIERSGDRWVTEKPGRVKENGPWRKVGISNHAEAEARAKADKERRDRLAAIEARAQADAACHICDEHGYLPNGLRCHHTEQGAVNHRGASLARSLIRPTVTPESRLAEDA